MSTSFFCGQIYKGSKVNLGRSRPNAYIYSMWQNSIDRYKAYDEGEYFVISNPDMVMDSENLEEFLTYNEVVEICKQNDWIIKY